MPTTPLTQKFGHTPHAWFEDREPRCTLIVFIDDATSRLMALRFAEAETTEAYMRTLRGYLDQHGRPVAIYSDKHSIFRVNQRELYTKVPNPCYDLGA